MEIVSFKGKDIYDYIDIDVKFNSDLTFLTGINGTGKTTVISLISALLQPDIKHLLKTNFKTLHLRLKHESKITDIRAKKTPKLFTLTCTSADGVFSIPSSIGIENFDEDYEYFSHAISHTEAHQLEIFKSENPVISQIKELPSPMFLGLDRLSNDPDTWSKTIKPWYTAEEHKTLHAKNRISLSRVIELSKEAYFDTRRKSDKSGLELRHKIVSSIFDTPPSEAGSPNSRKFPPKSIINKYTKIRDDVVKVLQELNILTEAEEEKIRVYFSDIVDIVEKIPHSKEISSIFDEDPTEDLKHGFRFLMMMPQIAYIEKLSRLIDKHSEKQEEIWSDIEQYKEIIKLFLGDTGKLIDFRFNGTPYVSAGDAKVNIDIKSLSSGEKQIFVLLTYLAFNPRSKSANVLFIDEPELSLHIKWQKSFVEAIEELNPELQVILATHSPAIIQNRIEKCISLDPEE
ncbi:AAA family ATPase [Terasakiella sp.]|uniref:AAA family ATPase n=1 Tax=Terasakiella sp. TaxID=2034861 RepID=UPI003AA8EECC